MLTTPLRRELREAQDEASIPIQVWVAERVRDADHGDTTSEKQLRLFLRAWRKTRSPLKAHAAVLLTYGQLTLEDI